MIRLPDRRALAVVLLVGWIVFLPGCGAKDIDKRYFVLSMGVDRAPNSEERLLVTLKLAIPKGRLQYGDSQFTILTQEGDTLSGAINQMRNLVHKELDFGHMKLMVFGESYARQGIMDTMDWLLRNQNIQQISWVAIGKPDARQVLEIRPKSERFPSNELFMTLSDIGSESEYTSAEYLFELYREISETGLDAVLPLIEGTKSGLRIERAAVLKDDQLKLVLTPAETRLFNIFEHKVNRLNIEAAGNQGDSFRRAMIRTETNKSTIHIMSMKDAPPRIQANLELSGKLEEVTPLRAYTQDELHEMEAAAGRMLTAQLQDLLDKLQKQGMDPFGIGLRYRAKQWSPEAKQAWEGLYPRASIDVAVKVEISSKGIAK